MFETMNKKVSDWIGVQRLRFRYYISSFLIGSGIVYCIAGAILLFSSPFYSYWLMIPAAISIGIGLALWKYRTEGARKALICWVVFFCLALVVLLVCLISEGRRASEYFQVLGSFFVLAGPAFVAVTHGSVLFGKGAPTHSEVRVHYLNWDLSALTIYRPDPDAEPTCGCKFFKAVGKFVGYIIGCIVCLCLISVAVGLILDRGNCKTLNRTVAASATGAVTANPLASACRGGRDSTGFCNCLDRQTDTDSHQPSEIVHEASNAGADAPPTEEMTWQKQQRAEAWVDLILRVADHFLSDDDGGETVIPAKLVIPE